VADRLPEHRIAWQAFPPRPVHWRLGGTTWEYLSLYELQAAGLARKIWDWLQPFQPEVLWVLGELAGVPVARQVHALSQVPVHVSIHDAPEFARFVSVPSLYFPRYLVHVRRLLKCAGSVDCVSAELLEHVRRGVGAGPGGAAPAWRGLIFPPCVEPALAAPVRPRAWQDDTRRIGFCGAFRVSDRQWQDVLDRLGRLPFRFELAGFASAGSVPQASVPANVTVHVQPPVATTAELIQRLNTEADACYAGLWREPARRLFGRTSLSSKLVPYAAAAVPVIVDAEEDTVAWRLVRQHAAGVRVGDPADPDALARLFGDAAAWQRMAEGARRLCLEEFDLDRHVAAFAGVLAETGSGPASGAG
jgi:glycosyltransferase involved in cell wall biosynthesis